jgi:hypothetical protein
MADSDNPIAGHDKLNAAQIGFINQIKHDAYGIRKLIETLEKNADCDPRWIEIGRTQMQLGFMALIRGVAKNPFF